MAQSFPYDEEEASASSNAINLKLIFSARVVSPVFTGRDMSGDGSIKLILVDSQTHEPVTTGPAAFATVKMVLIRGDLPRGDFQNNIVLNWGNKKNLLLGDRIVVLQEGSGTVGKIRIKHDSKPLKNVKFRLGAMVVGCPVDVKEAITDPFEVKDQRNEPKDCRRLLPDDRVCCLKNIKKRGPIEERLQKNGVVTVTDFLHMHTSEPRALKEMCGIKGKKWEATVNHAKKIRVENHVVESTCEQWDNMSSFGYRPESMVLADCGDLCVKDYEDCGLVEAFEASSQGKKRWLKVRATLWFSLMSFMKKLGLCVGATLAG